MSSSPRPWELVDAINQTVNVQMHNISTTEWDENHISFLLVQGLRQTLQQTSDLETQNSRSTHKRTPLRIQAEAYKVSGALEQTHGDIVVVITHVVDGYKVTGLGFYEAKAAGLDYGYPAFNMRQLRCLTSSTPRLSLLLYERTSMPVQDDEFSFPDRTMEARSFARARVLGANLASRFRKPDVAELYAQSFGYHFVTRYLSGRDLDYSRSPAASLRRWLRVTKRASPILVAVTVSNKDPEPPLAYLPEYVALPVPAPRLGAQNLKRLTK